VTCDCPGADATLSHQRADHDHDCPDGTCGDCKGCDARDAAQRQVSASRGVPPGTPCPTCRHYVIHLHEIGIAIARLRIGAAEHRGLHGRLMDHVTVGRRIKARRAAHLAEHDAARRDLATHLTNHAEGTAA
jgi:hypothetical protein